MYPKEKDESPFVHLFASNATIHMKLFRVRHGGGEVARTEKVTVDADGLYTGRDEAASAHNRKPSAPPLERSSWQRLFVLQNLQTKVDSEVTMGG